MKFHEAFELLIKMNFRDVAKTKLRRSAFPGYRVGIVMDEDGPEFYDGEKNLALIDYSDMMADDWELFDGNAEEEKDEDDDHPFKEGAMEVPEKPAILQSEALIKFLPVVNEWREHLNKALVDSMLYGMPVMNTCPTPEPKKDENFQEIVIKDNTKESAV